MAIFADLTHDEAQHLADFHAQYSALEAPAATLQEQYETAQQYAAWCKGEYGDTSAEYEQAALIARALGRLTERLAKAADVGEGVE